MSDLVDFIERRHNDREEKRPVLNVEATKAMIKMNDDGPVVELQLVAEGKHTARGLVRAVDETLILTQESIGGKRSPGGQGRVKRVSVSAVGSDPKTPTRTRAIVVGGIELEALVGCHLLAEKAQREMLEPEEPDGKSRAAGE